MVFLAIISVGLKEALRLAANSKTAIWCSSDALSEAEFEALRGNEITRFNYALNGETSEVLSGAIDSIIEHHPNEKIWVEHVPPDA
jgi:ABC-type branched-subunit amino acid transport system permease subunit